MKMKPKKQSRIEIIQDFECSVLSLLTQISITIQIIYNAAGTNSPIASSTLDARASIQLIKNPKKFEWNESYQGY